MNRKLTWFDIWDNDNLEDEYYDENIVYLNKPKHQKREPRGNHIIVFNKNENKEEDYIFVIGDSFSFFLYRMDSDTYEKKELITDGRIIFEVIQSIIETFTNSFEYCLEENKSHITYDKLKKVFETTDNEDLLEYLLDKNKGRRRIAEERLKEIENE